MNLIAERYHAVRNQVADAADCSGRSAQDVSIVAVTKHVGVPEIQAALAAGMLDFGENRVQEFEGKFALFPQARWHFIGHLQTNKVKDVVGKAHLIHSIDSIGLLRFVDRKAGEIQAVQPVLLEVNVSAETSKGGFDPDDVREAIEESSVMPNVEIRGLMTMAPFVRPEEVRWVFRELRELRDSLTAIAPDGVELEELSMGMTNDFRVAIEEGATIVRIGTAIFGR